MKLEDALPCVGLRDLRALAEAWGIDVVKRDEPAEYVDKFLANRAEILDREGVNRRLALSDLPYRTHMLAKATLRQLLNEHAYMAPVDDFHRGLIDQEKEFVDWATKPMALRHLDKKVVEIYETVLEAAWEDNVNASEFRLLERLRTKLGITRRDHRIVEIQLGKYPSASGAIHTTAEIEDAARHLLRRGLMLRVAPAGQPKSYCIPDEVASLIRGVLGIELTAPAYLNLLNQLPVSALRSALEAARQPFSGTREFLAARLVDGYVSPRAVLRGMTDEQLDKLLQGLPRVRQDGSREIRVRNIVRFFDSLDLRTPETSADRTETFISYYVELARRSYDTLRAAAVISKDRDIERYFEQATTALFRDFLGYPVEHLDGSDHPDGRATLEDPHRVVLWDCKSCETGYGLTDRLGRQFLAYASAAAPKVATPILVIAPAFSDDSAPAALKLKSMCPPGTEIALITADDLLWLARLWRQRRAKGEARALPWQVLAATGPLTRVHLEQHLKTFAS